MKVKTGQTVKVLSGKDKGKTGKVIQAFPKLEKVVVEGVNTMYKHLRHRDVQGGEKGERVEFFAPIHVSNVKVVEAQAEKKAENKEVKAEKKEVKGEKKAEKKDKKTEKKPKAKKAEK